MVRCRRRGSLRGPQRSVVNPDFVKLAESFGAGAARVTSPEAFRPVLEKALADGGPYVIAVEVPRDSETNPWASSGKAVAPALRGATLAPSLRGALATKQSRLPCLLSELLRFARNDGERHRIRS
jgi:hypothetical protein